MHVYYFLRDMNQRFLQPVGRGGIPLVFAQIAHVGHVSKDVCTAYMVIIMQDLFIFLFICMHVCEREKEPRLHLGQHKPSSCQEGVCFCGMCFSCVAASD